jgi:hypothetical protein
MENKVRYLSLYNSQVNSVVIELLTFGFLFSSKLKGLNVFNTAYVLADEKTASDVDFERVEGVIGTRKVYFNVTKFSSTSQANVFVTLPTQTTL